MSTIAKGEITLSPVNDAYTVAITPSSCVIKADFDGSNPQLDTTLCVITVKRGAVPVIAYIHSFETSSPNTLVDLIHPRGEYVSFKLSSIDETSLEGWVDANIVVDDGFGYTTKVRLAYSVVRESTMLDWIQDWEGSKTKIGGTYIMTPKLFVGKKEEVLSEINGQITWTPGELTGVYVGPDLLSNGVGSVGIYGYLKSQEIFHINAEGGFIGGWTFNNGGLQSGNGIVNILSEGSIYAQNPESITPYWGIYADGHAIFANGNVKFQANGNAEFSGQITSKSGEIGGWHINNHQLHSGAIIIDSNKKYIGINASTVQSLDIATGDVVFPQTPDGGIKMWHNSNVDFGFAGWANGKKVFQLGSTNFIAGWNFTHQALYTGSSAPQFVQGSYTEDADALTIAPSGIRSYKWYIDSDGKAAFVGGNVKFDTDKAEMFGWLMRTGRFSSNHAAVISSSSYCGFYVSPADLSEVAATSLITTISNNGGIYMYSDGANAILRAYDTHGNLGFRLSTNGYHQIGAWYFDHQSIYTNGTVLNGNGFTSSTNSIILSVSGLIGGMWKFLADGSGAVAGGNISWDAQGNVSFTSNVKLSWTSITDGPNLTKIDANGIYTGTISANNITAGTISTASIKSEGKWALNIDGSGSLASGNISWTQEGVLSVQKAIFDNVRINGTIRQPWSRSGIYISIGNESLTYDNIVAGASNGWNDGSIASMLTWTLKDSGRIVRIANWKWGSETFDGDLTINAPSGKYFFEDGLAKSKLVLSREIIELIGYADSTTFYGWAVVNRVNFNTRARYGRRLNCLAMGIVTDNGTATPNIQCTTFDGSSITVSRTATGVYEMTLPSAWQLEADGYQVMVTGYGSGYMKGTLASRTSTECVIHVSDDSLPNNGSFQFQIFNTNDWIG